MVKIYVKNKPLFLVDSISEEVAEYIHRPDTIFIDELNPSAVKTLLQQLEQEDFYGGVFLHSNLDELLKAFKSILTVIPAAGGLTYTKEKELLLIFRKGKWDLPKGKLDDGEDLHTCALREIKEETGAGYLQLEGPLKVTYHTYYERGLHILKESHWFLVRAKRRSSLKPQTEEDIEKCEWVPLAKVPAYIDHMHASLIDVMQMALTLLYKK